MLLKLKNLPLLESHRGLTTLPSGKLLINTINAHSYNTAQKDKLFAEALQQGDVLIPDGASIVKACRWLNARSKPTERIAGWNLFEFEMNKLNAIGGKCFFMGSSAAGKRVNERSAMQMTAVYSCVRILSEAVASLPIHVYKYNDSGGKEKALDHPLYFLLHDEPNPEMTSFVFQETLMTHLLLYGNAYAQII